MKKCLLAAHNLKYMFDKGNRVFFIVLISMSLSVFGMLFFAGYFLYFYYESEAGSKIVVTLSPDSSGEEICWLLSKLKNDEYGTQRVQLKSDNLDETMVIGEYNRQWDKNILVGHNYSLEEKHPYVIMAEYMVDFVKNGESPIGYRMWDDAKMKVYGIVPYTEYDGYCVPVNYYAMHYSVDEIQYNYTEKMDRKTIHLLNSILANSDIVASYQVIKSSNPFLSADFMGKFVQILLIFSVIIINIFCMAYSWIIHFKRNYRIYAICGADKKSIVEIIMIQTGMLMAMGVLFGNVLFFLCKFFLKDTNLVFQDAYFPYIGVSFMLMVILMIFSYLLAKRVARTNIIYQVRE